MMGHSIADRAVKAGIVHPGCYIENSGKEIHNKRNFSLLFSLLQKKGR
jgi:hypothetical protein